jgi:hypothetical protein
MGRRRRCQGERGGIRIEFRGDIGGRRGNCKIRRG